jgi:hypothetical protein
LACPPDGDTHILACFGHLESVREGEHVSKYKYIFTCWSV